MYETGYQAAGQAWYGLGVPTLSIGAVINELLSEKADAILTVPKFMHRWAAMLRQLPIKAVQELSYHASLYTIGSRAPSTCRG